MKMIHLYLWFPMILLAFANAMLRETALKDHLDEFKAQQISTVSLIVFVSLYVLLIFPKLQITSFTQALWLGILWTVLTFIFETALGKVTGRSWQEIFDNYNMASGNIWPLFLIFLLFLPMLIFYLKR